MAKIELKFGAISTDDHVQEAPDTWTARMSKAQWGDRETALADVPEAERRKILVENAVKLFKLDAS